MESQSVEELIQEAIRSMDAGMRREILFNREGRIIHANEKARSLFTRPLLTRHDLPEELTAGLDDALAKGRQSAFCFQVTGGPLLRNRIYPEYFDVTQREKPTCALLCMEEQMGRCVSRPIALHLRMYLGAASSSMELLHHIRNDPKRDAISLSAPDFQQYQKQTIELSAEWLFRSAIRVGNILSSVAGWHSDGSANVSLASLITKAYQNLKFYRWTPEGGVPTQLVCKGPDDLAFSAGRLGRLVTLFDEILLDLNHPSKALTVQWAEDDKKLGVPTAKIEFAVAGVIDGEYGFGLSVAEELTLDMHGCVELTPGNPGTLNLWLPLTLP
jgi:hypothetical protein